MDCYRETVETPLVGQKVLSKTRHNLTQLHRPMVLKPAWLKLFELLGFNFYLPAGNSRFYFLGGHYDRGITNFI